MSNVREIIVNSPKYGQKIILVDADRYDDLNEVKWTIYRSRRSRTFYAIREVKRERIAMHRLIIAAQKGEIVDHKDNNGLNNCITNLRICTSSQNVMNSPRSDNKYGYKGVYFKKSHNIFVARVHVNGETKRLGSRKTAKEAAELYNEGAIRYYGEFASLNSL